MKASSYGEGPGFVPPEEFDIRPSEDIFSDLDRPAAEDAGPISLHGYRPPPLHRVALGDFQVIRKLGSGSMGAVYLAHQTSLDRSVALKVLDRELAARSTYLARFLREAETMVRMIHPDVVRCHAVGESGGFHFIVMEYVEGYNTAQLLPRLGGRMGVPDALHVVRRTAEVLRFAHDQHIVHRDIKPQNIMITPRRQVKIGDLGLAKPTDQDLSLTDSGTGIGTPHYMPPEQMRNAKHADPRSDLYALGCVLYDLITGVPPFPGDSVMDVLHAKEDGFFPPARRLNWEVTDHLDLILRRLLASDPDKRYQTAGDLVHDLDQLHLVPAQLSAGLHAACQTEPGSAGPEEIPEILLVEDDPEAVELARSALEDLEHPVCLRTVRNCEEAWAYLQGIRHNPLPIPSLLLIRLDTQRPEALQFLVRLKQSKDFRGIPVVALTPPDAEEMLRAYDLHVHLCIKEPGEVVHALEMAGGGSEDFTLTIMRIVPD